MSQHAEVPEVALTFDDVLIVPGLSEVHPNEVDLRTRLCRGIEMNIPIVSAAMDTVTESRLAIAMAQAGGVGIIHKNLAIEAQAEEVDRVKRSEAGMIVDPVTMRPDQKIRDALDVMAQHGIGCGRFACRLTDGMPQRRHDCDHDYRETPPGAPP